MPLPAGILPARGSSIERPPGGRGASHAATEPDSALPSRGGCYREAMPYGETPRVARCYHCRAETRNGCVRCAHPVCGGCEARHDLEFPHKDYSG